MKSFKYTYKSKTHTTTVFLNKKVAKPTKIMGWSNSLDHVASVEFTNENQSNVTPFLHNEEGPAYVFTSKMYTDVNVSIYALNGRSMNKLSWEYELKKIEFNNKLTKILS